MYQLYLFDLDGTLIDSLEDLADASNYVLQQAHLPTHPVEAYRYFVGNGAYKLAERMLPSEMRTEPTIAQFKAAFDARYCDHYWDKTRPYPGIPELLDFLKQHGCLLAVLSNKPDPFVQKICREFFGEGYFDAVCGQRDGIAKKPEPDGVLEILNLLKVRPENALFIGDSNVDILTAQNAGLKSVGVTWGFRGRTELEEAGADFLIDTAEELRNL
ncbi:MAG: HAD family hydrolase [Candidatus Merdivicinus sp.]|jgi:phosphoglycolate phosphatase